MNASLFNNLCVKNKVNIIQTTPSRFQVLISDKDSIDYKKAMLLFYEQNNISAFKQIFIEQYRFAVETYF